MNSNVRRMNRCILLVVPVWATINWYLHSSALMNFEPSSRLSSYTYDGTASAENVGPFPRKLHYLWPNTNWSFGADDPDGIEQRGTIELVDRIRQNNPNWTLKIWTDDDCHALIKQYFPEFYTNWTNLKPLLKMWDAVRPAILYVHGGIYLDHDMDCDEGVNFSSWIRPETTLLIREPTLENRKLGNHFMGSSPNHPIWKLYIKNIVEEIPENYSVGKHTGPRQFYPTYQEYLTGISEEERAKIRLLGMNEVDMVGECERYEEYDGFCSQPRCSHTHTVSPAELAGEDDNPDKQVLEFKKKLAGNHYITPRCSCRRMMRFVSDPNCTTSGQGPCTVFIHTPKTGGTTIERAMGIDSSCHATASDLRDCNRLEFAKALSFTAIRHPVERAISLYRYAQSGGNGREGDVEKYEWVRYQNFSSFVDAIPSQDDPMYAPQTHFIVDHFNTSSFLVKEFICTENLEAGWEMLSSMSPHLRSYSEFPKERLRVGPSNSSSFITAEQVDNSTMEKLKEIFRDDFELWEEHCGGSQTRLHGSHVVVK